MSLFSFFNGLFGTSSKKAAQKEARGFAETYRNRQQKKEPERTPRVVSSSPARPISSSRSSSSSSSRSSRDDLFDNSWYDSTPSHSSSRICSSSHSSSNYDSGSSYSSSSSDSGSSSYSSGSCD